MINSRHIQNKVNISRILNLLWKANGISRSDIAKRLELDKSTITDATQKLIEARLVEEWKQVDGKGGRGRKPVFLRIREDLGVIIGIEYRPESFKAVFCNVHGTILSSLEGTHEVKKGEFVSHLSKLISLLISRANMSQDKILAIGIGISGIVDSLNGRLLFSIPFNIHEPVDLAEVLMKQYQVPIILENDANTCAWAELNLSRQGEGVAEALDEEIDSFLAVLGEIPVLEEDTQVFGFSVGLGMSINKRVHRGDGFFAGEFRSIFWNGDPDGQWSLHREELAIIHDSEKVRTKVFLELARQISLIANTLNFQAVYICGDLETYADEFIPILIEELKTNWSYEKYLKKNLIVMPSTYGDKVVAAGAAVLTLQTLFGIPDYTAADGGQSGKLRDLIFRHMGTLVE